MIYWLHILKRTWLTANPEHFWLSFLSLFFPIFIPSLYIIHLNHSTGTDYLICSISSYNYYILQVRMKEEEITRKKKKKGKRKGLGGLSPEKKKMLKVMPPYYSCCSSSSAEQFLVGHSLFQFLQSFH